MERLAGLAVIFMLAACSVFTDVEKAGRAAAEARSRIDARDGEGMEALMSSQAPAMEQGQMQRMIDFVHQRVGDCQPAAEPSRWLANRGTAGYFVTLTYERSCANGPLTEVYVIKLDDDPPTVWGFNLNSPALLPY